MVSLRLACFQRDSSPTRCQQKREREKKIEISTMMNRICWLTSDERHAPEDRDFFPLSNQSKQNFIDYGRDLHCALGVSLRFLLHSFYIKININEDSPMFADLEHCDEFRVSSQVCDEWINFFSVFGLVLFMWILFILFLSCRCMGRCYCLLSDLLCFSTLIAF